MRTALLFVLALSMAVPAFAQAPTVPFRDRAAIQSALDSKKAGSRTEGTRLARVGRAPQSVSPGPNDDPWPKRHAVLLGTLTGFAGGFAVGVATCKFPTAEGDSCRDYTFPGNAKLLGGFWIGGIGAAIGAGVGAIVQAMR